MHRKKNTYHLVRDYPDYVWELSLAWFSLRFLISSSNSTTLALRSLFSYEIKNCLKNDTQMLPV